VTSVEQLTFRRPAAADIDNAAAVFAAEEQAVRGRVTMGVDEMRDWWRLFDLDEGSWLVEDESGRAVGICCMMHREGDFDSWIGVRPEFQRTGLSTELLARAEQHARDAGGTTLKAGMLAENQRARALLESRDFGEVRRFYRMQIDFEGPLHPPDPVDGIRVAPFRPEDARAFHATINEAFAGDWGFHAMPFDAWKAHRLGAPETDTSLWFVAWDGHETAGAIRCDAKKFGGGWVGALGVRKPWRGRGIGMALLRQAFAEFHSRGAGHVGLGVDAANPTGATRLYERAGMRVMSEDIVFEKRLASS
jgi:ribosomal protein S18 acetylase RimI-like enzyme